MSDSKKSVLLLANGFDIDLCYKTKYSDFIKKVDEIIKDINHSSTSGYPVDKSNTNENTIYEFIKKIKNSYLLKFFLNHKDIVCWFSVETILLEMIANLDTLFKVFDYEKFDPGYAMLRFNVDSKYVQKKVPYYKLWQSEYNFTIDKNHLRFENISFSNNNDDYSKFLIEITKLKNKMYNDLLINLRNFSNLFIVYLNTYCMDLPKVKCNIECDLVVTYNYTNRMSSLINNCNNDIKTIFIHGQLPSEDVVEMGDFSNKDHIIFGIDSSNVFDYLDFNSFTKRNQRVLIDADLLNIPFENYDLHIYGHSLDLADEDSLKKIINKNVSKLTVYYYDTYAKQQLTTNLIRILGSELFDNKRADESLKFEKSDNVITK